MTQPRAVILLSGGLDSATTLAIARAEGYVTHALSFAYGQRHVVELEASKRVAAHLNAAEHRLIPLQADAFAGSALTDANIAVPKDRSDAAIAGGIPVTYVPARNTIFLAYALGYAEVIGANAIFIGVNAVDYSGYPDCRPEFIEAFEHMANLATAASAGGALLRIHTPLIHLTKAEIIRQGTTLGVDYSQTLSCYDPTPGGLACGHCDSCQLRRKGFADAGLADPTPYVRA